MKEKPVRNRPSTTGGLNLTLLEGHGGEPGVTKWPAATKDDDVTTASLKIVLLRAEDGTAVADAVREAKAGVFASLAAVKTQLSQMDVLVSGCGIPECNGRFKWVADQERSGYPRFENNFGHCLYRYEYGCDWRIDAEYHAEHAESQAIYAPREGDAEGMTGGIAQREWEQQGLIYIDSENMLPDGKHAWTDQKKLFAMLRAGAMSEEIEKATEIQHQVTIKLRRKRG